MPNAAGLRSSVFLLLSLFLDVAVLPFAAPVTRALLALSVTVYVTTADAAEFLLALLPL